MPMDSFHDVLSAAKEYCKERLVDATYNLYISQLEAVSFEGSTVFPLFPPDIEFRETLLDNVLRIITVCSETGSEPDSMFPVTEYQCLKCLLVTICCPPHQQIVFLHACHLLFRFHKLIRISF